jgi:hypothetical protein
VIRHLLDQERDGGQQIMKGWIMTTSALLAEAAKRESDAEVHYWKYIGIALAQRDLGACDFFYRMSDFRRLQVEAVAKWAGARAILQPELSQVVSEAFDRTLKEDAPDVGLNEAMDIALSTELRDMAFFHGMTVAAEDESSRRFAEELADRHRRQAEDVERYKGSRPY